MNKKFFFLISIFVFSLFSVWSLPFNEKLTNEEKTIIDSGQVFIKNIKFHKNMSLNRGNTITVYTKEPDIESSINYDLTTFKQENGIFAYGDLKLTPEYNQEIENTVCNKGNEEAKEENETARTNAEKILEDLLAKTNNRMNVKIVYVR